MKREEIKSIFPDATDEQLKAVMDLNGNDVEKAKSKVTALEAELKESKEGFEKLNAEFETLKTANADGAEWKTKFEALQAENVAREKQAEADRVLKEKTEGINKRFETAVGEKKFRHEAIKESYLKKFSEALENATFEGKSDNEIFHELTKDDGEAFQGATVIKLAGGKPAGTNGRKYTSREEIFNIKDSAKRQAEILNHPDLFPEINE